MISPMPAKMILSALALRATIAITSLKGWSESAKKGIFCPVTSVLFISIPAIPVAINSEGCFLLTGFTDGPPISTVSPSICDPPSIGAPYALKNLPLNSSPTINCGAWPIKITSALVGISSVPEKTCNVILSP